MDAPRAVTGYDHQPADGERFFLADDLRAYLKELEARFSDSGSPEEAAGVRVVLGDLFSDEPDERSTYFT